MTDSPGARPLRTRAGTPVRATRWVRRGALTVALSFGATSAVVGLPMSSVALKASATALAACASNLAEKLQAHGSARQLVTVESSSTSSTSAEVVLWQRRGACFARVGGPWPAMVGQNGLSPHHVEGDGTTPMGTFGFGPVMYGANADPGVAYAYHRLVCGDWWDEEPDSPGYNLFVHVSCGQRPPFATGSEALWTELPSYDEFAVIAYNLHPVVPGRGSGIFLHLSTGLPTVGCVALSAAALLFTLRWLRPADRPQIAIGTTASFGRKGA
ncbi:MAG: putative secreted protein [Acidimicrobiaceae bacterium]|nr:putative secreted protein [Acidimicrobiaceae bacterium]